MNHIWVETHTGVLYAVPATNQIRIEKTRSNDGNKFSIEASIGSCCIILLCGVANEVADAAMLRIRSSILTGAKLITAKDS